MIGILVIMGSAMLAFVLREIFRRIPGVIGRASGKPFAWLFLIAISFFIMVNLISNGFQIGGSSEFEILWIIGALFVGFAIPRLVTSIGRAESKKIFQRETVIRWAVVLAVAGVISVAMLINLLMVNFA